MKIIVFENKKGMRFRIYLKGLVFDLGEYIFFNVVGGGVGRDKSGIR